MQFFLNWPCISLWSFVVKTCLKSVPFCLELLLIVLPCLYFACFDKVFTHIGSCLDLQYLCDIGKLGLLCLRISF